MNDRITFVQNAITNARGKVVMKSPDGLNGNYMMQKLMPKTIETDTAVVQTALLSDIFDMIVLRSESHPVTVIIKMDIEGSQCKAISGSGHYFQSNDFLFIAVIIMEWRIEDIKKHCAPSEHNHMIDILIGNSYQPWEMSLLRKLNAAKADRWPVMDMVWIHESIVGQLIPGISNGLRPIKI